MQTQNKFERDRSGTVMGVKNEKFYRMVLGNDYCASDGVKIEASENEVTVEIWKHNVLVAKNIYPLKDCNKIAWIN